VTLYLGLPYAWSHGLPILKSGLYSSDILRSDFFLPIFLHSVISASVIFAQQYFCSTIFFLLICKPIFLTPIYLQADVFPAVIVADHYLCRRYFIFPPLLLLPIF
jgi:hypothetical protein